MQDPLSTAGDLATARHGLVDLAVRQFHPKDAAGPTWLQRLVVRSDRWPLRPVYRAIYGLGTRALRAALRDIPAVLGIYLSGSYAAGEQIHGASDIDFYVVMDGAQRNRLAEVERNVARCVAIFPFMGPAAERKSKILFTDSAGRIDELTLLYRSRSGLLCPLLERKGFALAGEAPTCVEFLAELRNQVELTLRSVRTGCDHLAFWKSRMRASLTLIANAGGDPPTLSPRTTQLLHSPGRTLWAVYDEELAAHCLQDFLRLVDTAYDLIAAACSQTQKVEVCSQGHSGGITIPGFPQTNPTVVTPTHESIRQFNGPVLVRLRNFLVGLGHPSFSVASRLDAPWFFSPPSGRTEMEVSSTFWQWSQVRAQRLLEDYAQRLEWGDTTLLGETADLLNTLSAVCHLRDRGPERITIYWDAAALLGHLRTQYPQYLDFFAELERQTKPGCGPPQHPNFLGFLIHFTKALLGSADFPPPSFLAKRYRLSLCVVTRDRPEWLDELLSTVLTQTRRADEVIIVDNSPTGTACAIVAKFSDSMNVRYFSQTEGHLGALRNRAIKESSGDLICFTDDDCLLEPAWLAYAESSFLKDDKIGAVGGQICHYPEFPGAIDSFHRIFLGMGEEV